MNGFLKRDFYLISASIRIYLLFIVAFGILVVFTDMSSGFVMLYVAIFAMSSMTGLFNYDEFNHWTAYAATVPNGRRDMVKARYVLLLLVTAGVTVIQFLVGTLAREAGSLGSAALYSGMILIYAAISMPVGYYFGGTRARMVTVVLVAFIAGAAAIFGTFLNVSTHFGKVSLPPEFLFLPILGLGLVAVSYRVSLGVMAKKEL